MATPTNDDKGKKVTDEAEQPICVEIPTKVSDVNKAAEMLGKYYACSQTN